jgi:predicted nucleic acid-binding protein
LNELLSSIENKECTCITSALVYTEIIPPIARTNNTLALENVIDFLGSTTYFEIFSLSSEICIQAGILRGTLGLKTPDALHVATAIINTCDIFITNDKRIQIPDNMSRLIISEYASYSQL